MSNDKLYSFVFKALLTEEALDSAGRKPRERFSGEWEAEVSNRLGLPLMDENLVIKEKKMSIIYVAICAFENSVREFVMEKLLEERGVRWWEDCVAEKIRKKAEQRKNSETNMRWHTPRGEAMIYYTDFGDLISIIAHTDNWQFFEAHIGTIDWVKHIITTLEKSRDIIMHGGELADTDI